MKQIEAISLGRLKKGQLSAFSNSINARVQTEEWLKAHCTIPVNLFDASLKQYDDLMMRHRVNLLTEKIQKANQERLKRYTFVRNLIRTNLDNADPAKQTAAELLWKVTKDFGYIPSMGIMQVSGILSAYCRDMTQNHPAEVTALELTDPIAEAVLANKAFVDVVSERNDSVAGFEKGELQAARTELTKRYRVLVQVTNAESNNGNEDKVAAFIDYANAEIAYYRIMVGQGSGTPTAKPELPDDEQKPNDSDQQNPNPDEKPDENPDNDNQEGNTGGDTLKPDPDAPGTNPDPDPTPGEGNGENEDEYTPPDNDGGFGK